MLKFLVDEDLPRSTTLELKNAGIDATDIRACGLKGKSDEEVFAYAQEAKAIILTGDRGFGSILRFPPGTYHGIVIANFPNETTIRELNDAIIDTLNGLHDDDIIGNLIIIEPKKIRIRRYPKLVI